MKIRLAAAVLLAAISTGALATDEDEYNRRAAERDMALFYEYDLDHDGNLTREEVRGNVSLQARFNDININRDGKITLEEMQRYIAATYHVAAPNPLPQQTMGETGGRPRP